MAAASTADNAANSPLLVLPTVPDFIRTSQSVNSFLSIFGSALTPAFGVPDSTNQPPKSTNPTDPYQFNPNAWNFFDGLISSVYNITTSVLPLIGNNNLDLKGSFNCVSCLNTTCAANSTNVSHSIKVLLSKNLTSSFYVFNSTNVSSSYNVSNSTNISGSYRIRGSSFLNDSRFVSFSRNSSRVGYSRFIYNSKDVFGSSKCINCTNCTLCTLCANVTNGYNLTNVTNSANVENTFNGTNLTFVYWSENVMNIFNGSYLYNASDTWYASNNANCTGGECNITKFAKELAVIVDKKLLEQSYTIIDQLYTFYRVGNIASYNASNASFDPEIFRSQQKMYDLSSWQTLFAPGGMRWEYTGTLYFRKDANPVKEQALRYLLKKELLGEDEQFNVVNNGWMNQTLVDYLNKEADLEFLDSFNYDVDRVPIPYQYVANRTEKELLEEQAYYDSLAIDYDPATEPAAETKPNATATPATDTKVAADIKAPSSDADKKPAATSRRKLVSRKHPATKSKQKSNKKTHKKSRKLRHVSHKKKHRSVSYERRRLGQRRGGRTVRQKYAVKKIIRKMV